MATDYPDQKRGGGKGKPMAKKPMGPMAKGKPTTKPKGKKGGYY